MKNKTQKQESDNGNKTYLNYRSWRYNDFDFDNDNHRYDEE